MRLRPRSSPFGETLRCMETRPATLTGSEPPIRLLIPVDEARRLLGGISPATFYRLVGRGELVAVKCGGRRFVRHRDLLAYIDGLQG